MSITKQELKEDRAALGREVLMLRARIKGLELERDRYKEALEWTVVARDKYDASHSEISYFAKQALENK